MEGLIRWHAARHGVDPDVMVAVAKCESGLVPDRQSDHTYREGNRWGFPAGTREKSFGIMQVHLPDHPDISESQAKDPDWSSEWAAKQFAAGNARWWTCWRTQFG